MYPEKQQQQMGLLQQQSSPPFQARKKILCVIIYRSCIMGACFYAVNTSYTEIMIYFNIVPAPVYTVFYRAYCNACMTVSAFFFIHFNYRNKFPVHFYSPPCYIFTKIICPAFLSGNLINIFLNTFFHLKHTDSRPESDRNMYNRITIQQTGIINN